MENNYYPFVNTPLPYAYDALEPYIDEKTMHLHHDKHLQTYIDNLNAVLKNCPNLQKTSLEDMLSNICRLPQDIKTKVKNNAGGVYNHRFYFEGMKSSSKCKSHVVTVDEGLESAINRFFGNMQNFTELFRQAALGLFGSGYVWLIYDRTCNALRIYSTANQDTPLEKKYCPILCIDVWEHAYYLKHYNVRADYIGDWMNIIDWEKAGQRYQECTGKN